MYQNASTRGPENMFLGVWLLAPAAARPLLLGCSLLGRCSAPRSSRRRRLCRRRCSAAARLLAPAAAAAGEAAFAIEVGGGGGTEVGIEDMEAV